MNTVSFHKSGVKYVYVAVIAAYVALATIKREHLFKINEKHPKKILNLQLQT